MTSSTECFASHGAKRPDPQWALPALAAGGPLVPGCRGLHRAMAAPGLLRGDRRPLHRRDDATGDSRLQRQFERARDGHATRAVVATPVDSAVAGTGGDAGTRREAIHFRPDLTRRPLRFGGGASTLDSAQATP